MILLPTYLKRRIQDITPEFLRKEGIRGLLLDVDNTLTTHNSPDLSPAVSQWLRDMRDAGMKLMIISNNHRERVHPFADRLGLPFLPDAKKPLSVGVHHCLSLMKLGKEETAIVGDQIFTDVMAGNLSGIRSILLEPIDPGESWFIRFKRRLEKPVIAAARKKAGQA